MSRQSHSLLFPSLVVVASGALWGLFWLPVRYMENVGFVGPSAGASINLAPAILLIFVSVWRGAGRAEFRTALLAGCLIGLAIALFTTGLVYASVARVTLLFYLMPIWSSLIGYLWLNERIGWSRLAGIACGLAGLFFLLSGKQPVPLNIGDVLALLSGVLWAIGASLVKETKDMQVLPLSAIQFAVASAAAFALTVLLDEPMPPMEKLVGMTPFLIAVALFLLMPTVLGLSWAQKRLFPGRVGILLMSEVIVSLISASILLPEERLAGLQWLGCALIVGAFLLETLGSNAADQAETEA